MTRDRQPSNDKLQNAFPKPTAQVEPYVQALGLEDALKFIGAFGGTEIYIATAPKSRSRVVEVVGYAKARILASISETLPRRVPLAKQWRARVYASKGLPNAEIARMLGVTDETVRSYLRDRGPPRDTDQLSLF
ncbi:helix-turn-helix domain-containing protein [Phaeobacter sp. HF9A]|uniref:helix-turn-helix domain-containing protein n=1 Tax=Phaeobacter sp. HF9A TaxID=2721561 RepID=UPI00142FF493|nr:helix-turn-helix domain-containing protein [Phaeobacter sp. HF9A]NIZ13926.1 helix-turn-helix domain-containing protein [Phaeobacter sp. HF9A]